MRNSIVFFALLAMAFLPRALASSPPAGYTLVETIVVPTGGNSVASATTLQQGLLYKIRASGTFGVGGPGDGLADAEYADFSGVSGHTPRLDFCGSSWPGFGVDIGLSINDPQVHSYPDTKHTFWGAYDPSNPNEYTIDFLGEGAPVSINYHDCFYPDNRGTLTVEIFDSGVTEVAVDIKPGSDPNSINCSNGDETVTVGILTTEDFDATTIDPLSVSFEGAREIHIPGRHEEDLDGDSDIDLVLHFRVADTDLVCDSTHGTLIGETFNGMPIAGTDTVRMVGPKIIRVP